MNAAQAHRAEARGGPGAAPPRPRRHPRRRRRPPRLPRAPRRRAPAAPHVARRHRPPAAAEDVLRARRGLFRLEARGRAPPRPGRLRRRLRRRAGAPRLRQRRPRVQPDEPRAPGVVGQHHERGPARRPQHLHVGPARLLRRAGLSTRRKREGVGPDCCVEGRARSSGALGLTRDGTVYLAQTLHLPKPPQSVATAPSRTCRSTRDGSSYEASQQWLRCASAS